MPRAGGKAIAKMAKEILVFEFHRKIFNYTDSECVVLMKFAWHHQLSNMSLISF